MPVDPDAAHAHVVTNGVAERLDHGLGLLLGKADDVNHDVASQLSHLLREVLVVAVKADFLYLGKLGRVPKVALVAAAYGHDVVPLVYQHGKQVVANLAVSANNCDLHRLSQWVDCVCN